MGRLPGALRKLDDVLPVLAAKSLAPPANAKQLDLLARLVFDGELPAELREWFGWHDGQRRITSLDPANNFTAMRASESRAIWRMLNDPKQDCLRPRPSWIPLFENGGGDYLMYETKGRKRGALFVYWHDDENWPAKPEYRSLLDWATRVTKAQAKVAVSERKSPGKPSFELGKLKFEKIGRVPTLATLAKAEVGTVIRCARGRDWFVVWMKPTTDDWLWNAGETFGAAIEELEGELRKLKRSEYKCDAAYAHRELAELGARDRATISLALARPITTR